jgi:cytochrome P450
MTPTLELHTLDIDLTDISLFTERREHDAFKRLRDVAPVHFNRFQDGGFYALTRHEHVSAVAYDTDRFISGKGTQIADKRAEGKGAPSVHNADKPLHVALRKAGQKALRRPLLETRRARFREIISELIEAAPRNRPFDFVADIAVKIPMIVFSEVLGVPENMQHQLVEWANMMSDVRASEGEQAENRRRLFEYFRTLAAEKRKFPGEDIASSLVQSRIDGELMDEQHLDAFFMVLTVAGNETTRFLLAGALEQLCHSPREMEKLRSAQTPLRIVVEEMVRWVSPVIHMRRTATEALDLFGTPVPAGAKVVLYFASANRDERAFGEDAGRFRIDRDPNPHLGFGHGSHFCLGAHLARMEAVIFWEEFLKQISEVRLCGLGERLPSHWFAGLNALEVEWA